MNISKLQFIRPKKRSSRRTPALRISKQNGSLKLNQTTHKFLFNSYFKKYTDHDGRFRIAISVDHGDVLVVINPSKDIPQLETALDQSVSSVGAIYECVELLGLKTTSPEFDVWFEFISSEPVTSAKGNISGIVYRFRKTGHEYYDNENPRVRYKTKKPS